MEPIKARGLCRRHYDQMQHGVALHPLGPKPEPWPSPTSIGNKLIARLANYQIPEVCWEISGQPDRYGYGAIYHERHYQKAHRLAHTLWIGPVPEGHVVLHRCGNLLCCNPDHLYTGILADIDTDETKRLRAKPPKLTPDDVRAIRADNRTQTEIARAYRLSDNTISCLLLGKTYRDVV